MPDSEYRRDKTLAYKSILYNNYSDKSWYLWQYHYSIETLLYYYNQGDKYNYYTALVAHSKYSYYNLRICFQCSIHLYYYNQRHKYN